jgi:hypothetical protein
MSSRTRRLAAIAVATAATAALGAGDASAGFRTPPPAVQQQQQQTGFSGGQFGLLARAQPDECFGGIGADYVPFNGSCPAGRVPKINQSYVWGMVQTGNDVWFGTAASPQCLIGATDSSENEGYVCEGEQSDFRNEFSPPLPDFVGDWRPPDLYRYRNAGDGSPVSQMQVSPNLQRLTLSGAADDLRKDTMGFRSAGALGNVVFIAGPSLEADGVNVFAFDRTTGLSLGAQKFPQWDDIRRWTVVDGVLYAAVAKTGLGGALIRWTGDFSNPFSFAEVGSTPTEASEVAGHNGRLYVGTWPDLTTSGPVGRARVFRSVPIPAGGFTTASPSALAEIWDADQYEPDPVIRATYGVGAMQSFRGRLLFGTMHVPSTGALAHLTFYGNDYPAEGPNTQQLLDLAVKTNRATTLFSTDGEGTTPAVELLYGYKTMPVWIGNAGNGTGGQFVNTANLMASGGQSPRYGRAGFGNDFNGYLWSMVVGPRGLYIGTLDWQGLLGPLLAGSSNDPQTQLLVTLLRLQFRGNQEGADLFRMTGGIFGNSLSPVTLISGNGAGNTSNYGIRNLSTDGNRIFLGTANPFNKRASGPAMGGWELKRTNG